MRFIEREKKQLFLFFPTSIFERLFCSRYWDYQVELDMVYTFKRFTVWNHGVRHRGNHNVTKCTQCQRADTGSLESAEQTWDEGVRVGFKWSQLASWRMAHLSSILIKRKEGKRRKFQSQEREGKNRDSGEGRADCVVRNNKQIILGVKAGWHDM